MYYDRGKVRIRPLLDDPLRFPWDIMDLTYPVAGPVHSYICYALAKYQPEKQRSFLMGKPALFELRKFAGKYEGSLAKDIIDYVDDIEEGYVFRSTARWVLGFLVTDQEFIADFQSRIDRLYLAGLISIPEECKP